MEESQHHHISLHVKNMSTKWQMSSNVHVFSPFFIIMTSSLENTQ